MWLSLVERCVRDAEAAGSNPVNPTMNLSNPAGLPAGFVVAVVINALAISLNCMFLLSAAVSVSYVAPVMFEEDEHKITGLW